MGLTCNMTIQQHNCSSIIHKEPVNEFQELCDNDFFLLSKVAQKKFRNVHLPQWAPNL